jgi:type I restriction enzyme S subunit
VKLRDSFEFEKSRYDWIGLAPKSWSVYPLYALCEAQSGFLDGDWIESEDIDVNGTIRYLTSGNVGVGKYKDQGSSFITEKKFKDLNCTEVLPGDILISRLNLPIARACIVPKFDSKVITCVDNVIVRPNKNVSRSFLVYLLSADHHFANTKNLGRGTTMQRISGSTLGKIRFAIPNYDEQVLISNFLDFETRKIDSLIAEQEKLIELLKTKLDSLVLGSFNHSDTKFSKMRYTVDIIERPVIQDADQTYEPLGLLNRGRGLFHKEIRAAVDMGDSDFYWVEEGDLILSGQFAWEGAVALSYKEEEGCVVSHRYPVIRGKKDIALTEYLFALLTTDHGNFLLNESSVGAAGRNRPLNMNLLLNEVIPIPNIKIQEKIAELVLTRKNLLEEIEEQSKLLNEKRAALILAAVTGQIDVRNCKIKEAA